MNHMVMGPFMHSVAASTHAPQCSQRDRWQKHAARPGGVEHTCIVHLSLDALQAQQQQRWGLHGCAGWPSFHRSLWSLQAAARHTPAEAAGCRRQGPWQQRQQQKTAPAPLDLRHTPHQPVSTVRVAE